MSKAEEILANVLNGKGDNKKDKGASISELFGEEEKVAELTRNGSVTGVAVRKEVQVDKVTYDEVRVEYANSEAQHMYEGILVSKESGYRIRFRVYNEKMVDFERYDIKDLKLKKLLLDAIAEVMPELIEDFELNVRACM